MAIAIQDASVLYNGNFLEPGIYKKYVLKKALEAWKQLGSDETNLKRNENHIKTLALKIHSVSPHNAACERVFSILVENAKSELNYVDQNLRQENLLSTFNQIANSIEDGNSLLLEELTEKDAEEVFEKNNLVNKNSTNLEVRKFISLSSNLESSRSLSKDVIYGDKDFD
ncbi:29861_t:CDS:2, partial [Racocetra persica]